MKKVFLVMIIATAVLTQGCTGIGTGLNDFDLSYFIS